jgi:hypothetical protein
MASYDETEEGPILYQLGPMQQRIGSSSRRDSSLSLDHASDIEIGTLSHASSQRSQTAAAQTHGDGALPADRPPASPDRRQIPLEIVLAPSPVPSEPNGEDLEGQQPQNRDQTRSLVRRSADWTVRTFWRVRTVKVLTIMVFIVLLGVFGPRVYYTIMESSPFSQLADQNDPGSES